MATSKRSEPVLSGAVEIARPLMEAAHRFAVAVQDAGELANGGRAAPTAFEDEEHAREALHDAALDAGDPVGKRWREWCAIAEKTKREGTFK